MAMFAKRYLNFNEGNKTPFKGRSLLWPVWCWEILVPKTTQNQLNIFQRSILGLFHAKKTDTSEISEWLGIEQEMVLYIIASQLQPNGWMDNKGRLTEKGVQILEDDLDIRRILTTGYIFQDAITGKLWPRVADRLPDVEPESYNSKGFPVFAINRDRGWKDEPFALNCSVPPPTPPGVHELKSIIEQGNNAIHNQRIRDEILNEEQDEFEVDEIDQITVKPFKSYIFCWAIPDIESNWAITDPIAVSPKASWMKEVAIKQLDHNPALAGRLRSLIGEAPQEETWEEKNKRIIADVELQIFADFPGTRQIPHLASCLGILLRREQDITATDEDTRFEDCNDLVTQSQRVFEACFRWMLNKWPIAHEKIFNGSWSKDEILYSLQEIASGFLSPEDIDNLSNQKAKSIWYAANRSSGTSSLRPIMTATLFTLTNHADHPLMRFKLNELNLGEILALTPERNSVSHASSKEIHKNYALDCAAFTTQWVKKLLGNIE